MSAPPELIAEITALGDTIRQLKLNKEPIAEQVAKLKELKALLPPDIKPTKAEDVSATKKAGGGKKSKQPSTKLVLKVPKVSSAMYMVAAALSPPGAAKHWNSSWAAWKCYRVGELRLNSRDSRNLR